LMVAQPAEERETLVRKEGPHWAYVS